MKLLCDDNLGKLAKYLRMLGFDTYFKSSVSDAELLGVMLKENRFVLTRDHQLIKRIESGRYLLLESNIPEEQLKAVIDNQHLEIVKGDLFSRCLECNEKCVEISKDEIKADIFPYIMKTQDKFMRCPSCRRIYWQGSHYKDMVEKLKEIIEKIK